jgi:hypothetical protein
VRSCENPLRRKSGVIADVGEVDTAKPPASGVSQCHAQSVVQFTLSQPTRAKPSVSPSLSTAPSSSQCLVHLRDVLTEPLLLVAVPTLVDGMGCFDGIVSKLPNPSTRGVVGAAVASMCAPSLSRATRGPRYISGSGCSGKARYVRRCANRDKLHCCGFVVRAIPQMHATSRGCLRAQLCRRTGTTHTASPKLSRSLNEPP